MTTATRPSYREPWQHGAKAYPEADSLDAILVGIKRKRNALTVLIHHDGHGLDGVPCASCGQDLAGPYLDGRVDRYAMVDVTPRGGKMVPRHYYCAWGATMEIVASLREGDL